jgi:hypothetical protein
VVALVEGMKKTLGLLLIVLIEGAIAGTVLYIAFGGHVHSR